MKNSPVRVMLIGAAGRMGKTVLDLAQSDREIEIAARCDLDDSIEPAMKHCDVAIDFSQADSKTIEETAHSIPIVLASNFSVGVNVLFWLTQKAAELLGSDFNPEIVETHHKIKKDAPSGTAKTLAEILKVARNSEIPIQSIREGDVVGEHSVVFGGADERLELTHRAANRGIFARGALRAAKWIVDKPPRLYSMQDVLGL